MAAFVGRPRLNGAPAIAHLASGRRELSDRAERI
jgi:hypothetical protein